MLCLEIWVIASFLKQWNATVKWSMFCTFGKKDIARNFKSHLRLKTIVCFFMISPGNLTQLQLLYIFVWKPEGAISFLLAYAATAFWLLIESLGALSRYQIGGEEWVWWKPNMEVFNGGSCQITEQQWGINMLLWKMQKGTNDESIYFV